MAPFTFRLEQVRLYRKQLEEQAMQLLAQSVMRRDAIRARLNSLERALAEQRMVLSRVFTLDAGERWLANQYEGALKQDIAETVVLLHELEKQVDAYRTDLVEKAKARGLLDSLKEKQAAKHQRQELQNEQKNNDETATLRHKPVAI